jgi:hypothetical protein
MTAEVRYFVDKALLDYRISEQFCRYPPDLAVRDVALKQIYIAYRDLTDTRDTEIERVATDTLAAAVGYSGTGENCDSSYHAATSGGLI